MVHVLWLGKTGLTLVLWFGAGATASAPGAPAQGWAAQMFDHTSHDFGTVARGAKVEHRFEIENIYVEDVHVESVRSTCGCTAQRAGKDFLKAWERAEIVVTMDTRQFLGHKDATVKVKFDQPLEAEVQLQIHCNTHGDAVVQPGTVGFGCIPQGSVADRGACIVDTARHPGRLRRHHGLLGRLLRRRGHESP